MSAPDIRIEVDSNMDSELALVLDPASLDPTMTYRVVQDRPNNVARKRMLGYTIVRPSVDKVRTLVDNSDGAVEDMIRIGDGILMKCDKEAYLRRRRDKRQQASQRLASTTERFREQIDQQRRKGIRTRMIDTYDDRGPADTEE